MAKKSNLISTNSMIFGGVLSGFAAIAVVGLICISLFGLGYYLLVKYNKPGTKLFKELQPMQYLGIFLCVLGVLPFIQYFFMGFLAEAGSSLFESMFE
jgi:uncharacterized membrane protein (Fun14 family)